MLDLMKLFVAIQHGIYATLNFCMYKLLSFDFIQNKITFLYTSIFFFKKRKIQNHEQLKEINLNEKFNEIIRKYNSIQKRHGK